MFENSISWIYSWVLWNYQCRLQLTVFSSVQFTVGNVVYCGMLFSYVVSVENWHYLGVKAKSILSIHLSLEETQDMNYICLHSTQNCTHCIHLCVVMEPESLNVICSSLV